MLLLHAGLYLHGMYLLPLMGIGLAGYDTIALNLGFDRFCHRVDPDAQCTQISNSPRAGIGQHVGCGAFPHQHRLQAPGIVSRQRSDEAFVL